MQWWRVSLRDLGRSGDARGGGVRVDWADTAKAVSIVLLVFWTLEGTSLHVNRMLNLARMPLFFFVSGLFAWRVVTRTDFGTFARDKVGNLVYLYLLWATLLSPRHISSLGRGGGGRSIPGAQVALLWDPFVPMWFFYGLAIAFVVAWACRDLPVALVTTAALAAHVVAVATGDWLSIPVFEKVVRLFPWFWLGLVFRPAFFALVERHWRLWPLPLAAHLLLSYAFFDTSWNRVGPLTFAITGVGVAPLALVSAQLSRLPLVAGPLAVIGASTLYIYATQHVTIFYLERAARFLGVPFELVTIPALVVVVAAGTIFGRWAAGTVRFAWLFRAPWLGRGAGAGRESMAAA